MDKKNSVLLLALNGMLLVVIICLIVMIAKPQAVQETRLSGSLQTEVSGVIAQNNQNQSNVSQPNVPGKPGEQVISLGGNRFAVIDNNPNSETHGNVLVYEYDEQSHKLNFLTSENYIARMNQRTE
ncbi:hypothetical protein [Paenibacillus sp.]|uniref:hypothetical protein n=1 Tax=Paenibacillus sp. TaxID=58172 RepID=UPI00281C1239|nr:hypothetical protein [Paenibacillus sp.]MDR0266979.1 hypothetical protein [Paenibacillus sp.]